MSSHFIARILAGFLATVLSYIYRETLRDRVYRLEEREVILATAIEDIARINHAGAQDPLITGICSRVIKNK